jgi:hypothetical protein
VVVPSSPPGLADTLKTGNYTVFAPTDAAFAKLPAGTVVRLCGAPPRDTPTVRSLRPSPPQDALLKDKTRLTEILLFHVAKGKTVSKVRAAAHGCLSRGPSHCLVPQLPTPTDPRASPSLPACLLLSVHCQRQRPDAHHVRDAGRQAPRRRQGAPHVQQPDRIHGPHLVVPSSATHPPGSTTRPALTPDATPCWHTPQWKAVIVVDPKDNGKNGTKLKIGQNCAVVQGLEYEVRGTFIPNGRRSPIWKGEIATAAF